MGRTFCRVKESDQEIPDGSDHNIFGKEIDIVLRQTTIATQNHDEKDPSIRNCNEKSNNNLYCSGSYAMEHLWIILKRTNSNLIEMRMTNRILDRI